MISVLATIEVAEGRRDEFLAVFGELVPKVRAEEGCIEYGPWIDLPTAISSQEEPRTDVMIAIEKWESIEALEAHLVAPHMLDFRKSIEGLVANLELEILEPA
ncbi:MAG: putative quinol monooxygenase [Thermoguttaceae bacterium]